MSELTTEQKLQAIIEAQVKGGYSKWSIWGNSLGCGKATVDPDGFLHKDLSRGHTYNFIQVILLDSVALKAVWQNDAQEIGNAIFNEWFSTGGDATATIDLAFFNLPK